MFEMNHVDGKNAGKIVLYALSTCVWCKKTRSFLDELQVEYYFTYVDLLETEDNTSVKNIIRQWNPQCSFPTLVINDEKCIVGFDKEQLMQELNK